MVMVSRNLQSAVLLHASRPLQARRLLCVRGALLVLWAALAVAGCAARAQSSSEGLPDAPTPQPQQQPPQQSQDSDNPVTMRGTPRRVLEDQESIWTSPLRLRDSNALGPAALVIATTVLITTDHQVMSSSKLQHPGLNDDASKASDGLLGGFVAAPAALFTIGELRDDDHASETGILAGEAVVDSLAVSYVFKGISRRERPTVDGAKGKFFQPGVGLDSSFPSNHCIVAWSSAAVMASEYGGILTQITAYGLATGVSATRILARQHFPSDVLVGSAVGWMIGRYVARKHRNT
jgi:hypothetical protein